MAPEGTEFPDGPLDSWDDANHLADDGRQAETPGQEVVQANFGPGAKAHRKETKRRRDPDDSGAYISGNRRKPSRSSKAEKRRIEEEDRASLDKAMRASRHSPAPKQNNDNIDLDDVENCAI